MSVQVTHVIVHSPEQTEGIVDEALRIADDHDLDPELRIAVFREACRLLGQRFTFTAEPKPVPMPAMAIPTLRQRH